jgi:hypothetical protein
VGFVVTGLMTDAAAVQFTVADFLSFSISTTTMMDPNMLAITTSANSLQIASQTSNYVRVMFVRGILLTLVILQARLNHVQTPGMAVQTMPSQLNLFNITGCWMGTDPFFAMTTHMFSFATTGNGTLLQGDVTCRIAYARNLKLRFNVVLDGAGYSIDDVFYDPGGGVLNFTWGGIETFSIVLNVENMMPAGDANMLTAISNIPLLAATTLPTTSMLVGCTRCPTVSGG